MDIDEIKQEVSDITHEFDRKVAMQVIDYLHSRGYLGGVPDGYVAVPKEPTGEMIAAGDADCDVEWLDYTPEQVYKSMIAAAPKGEMK